MKSDLIGRTFSRIGTAFFGMSFVVYGFALLMIAAPITYIVIVLAVMLFFLCAVVCTFFLILLDDAFRESFTNLSNALSGEEAQTTINAILAGVPIVCGVSIALFAITFIFLMVDCRYKPSLAKGIISGVFLVISILTLVVYMAAVGQVF